MDCYSGWVDRKGAGLLGNQPESCWDEGCDAGCRMFMINSGSSELPAMEGPSCLPGPLSGSSLLLSQGSGNTEAPGASPLQTVSKGLEIVCLV